MTLAKSQDLFSAIICLGTSGTLSPQCCKTIVSCSSSASTLASLFFFGFLSSEHAKLSSYLWPLILTFFGSFLFSFPFSEFARASLALSFSLFISFESNIQVHGFSYGLPTANAYIYFQSLEPSPKVKGRFSAGVPTIH